MIAASVAAIGIAIALYNVTESAPYKNSKIWNFDSYRDNSVPDGFLSMQAGGGQGTWVIKSDDASVSKPNLLAKLSSDDNSSIYNIQIMPDGISTSNSKTSVKFKIISGQKEQTTGLVFRYQDQNHYYVLIADAINHRFSLCRAEPEKVICTQDKNVDITTGQWHTITAQVAKQGIAGYLDDKLLIQRYDQHYMKGTIGLWTKGDSKVYFDDLKIDY